MYRYMLSNAGLILTSDFVSIYTHVENTELLKTKYLLYHCAKVNFMINDWKRVPKHIYVNIWIN